MLRLTLFALLFIASTTYAQEDARSAREMNMIMGRYEQMVGKLQQQNERLLGDIRALQKEQDKLRKEVESAAGRGQNAVDEVQRLKNEQEQESKNVVAWGQGQRGCPELKVDHQQIKVSVKPDGTRGVRYLCFDGKALHLGSEVYTVGE